MKYVCVCVYLSHTFPFEILGITALGTKEIPERIKLFRSLKKFLSNQTTTTMVGESYHIQSINSLLYHVCKEKIATIIMSFLVEPPLLHAWSFYRNIGRIFSEKLLKEPDLLYIYNIVDQLIK